LAYDAALGMPENEPRTGLVLDAEEIEFFHQPPVVAPLRFFELRQEIVQLLLAEEGRPVNALHGMRALIAFPVRAGYAQQLDGLDAPRGGDVRPTAKVQELAGTIGGEYGLGLFLDELALQELAHLREELLSFFLGKVDPLIRIIRLDDLAHTFFNLLEIIFREWLLPIEVVIEAGLGGWADSRVRVGEKFGDRCGQKVSRRMAVNLQALGRGWSNELDRRVLLDRRR